MSFQIHGQLILGNQANRTLPSFRDQVAHAMQAARKVAAAAVRGDPIWLTPAKREEWRAICQSNLCGYYRAKDQRCTHPDCGCFAKLKTRLTTERCPAGLFPR
jgi:hypothetical protein